MEEISISEIKEIIDNGDFEKLKGRYENEFLDCKREIYKLTTSKEKHELAKDVSSFANAEGGYILIGPQTEPSKSHPFDEIKNISCMHQNLIDSTQYYNIIKDWIFPEILDITIKWKQSRDSKDKGIVVIHIPKQDDNSKPFLIKKTITKNETIGTIFGYFERRRDQTSYKDVQTIHTLLRNGLNYTNEIKNKLDEINQKIDLLRGEETEEIEDFKQDISERITKTLKINRMDLRRVYILAAYPKKPNKLKTIFEKKEGSILRRLEKPGGLRYAGWDLQTLDTAKIYEGEYIQVCNAQNKTIRLYKDGTMIFTIDCDLLTWHDEAGLKINCLAIIESAFNFVKFYKSVIGDFSSTEDIFVVEFGFKNLHKDGHKSYLCAYSLGSDFYEDNTFCKSAPKNDYISGPNKFECENMDERKVTYELVKKIYPWFEIPTGEGRLPYVKSENGVDIIDIEQIVKL
jgi:hypothetical protein